MSAFLLCSRPPPHASLKKTSALSDFVVFIFTFCLLGVALTQWWRRGGVGEARGLNSENCSNPVPSTESPKSEARSVNTEQIIPKNQTEAVVLDANWTVSAPVVNKPPPISTNQTQSRDDSDKVHILNSNQTSIEAPKAAPARAKIPKTAVEKGDGKNSTFAASPLQKQRLRTRAPQTLHIQLCSALRPPSTTAAAPPRRRRLGSRLEEPPWNPTAAMEVFLLQTQNGRWCKSVQYLLEI